VSTATVVHLCSRDNSLASWKLLLIITINLTHIAISGLDQFVAQVIQLGGKRSEVFRDLALMAPDIFHVSVAYFKLYQLAAVRKTSVSNLFGRKVLLMSFVAVILVSLLCHYLL